MLISGLETQSEISRLLDELYDDLDDDLARAKWEITSAISYCGESEHEEAHAGRLVLEPELV